MTSTEPEHPRRGGRLRGSLADRLEVLLPLGGYVAAVLSGASTSSLNALQLQETPGGGVDNQIGKAVPIRSDEWFTQAPLDLQVIADGRAISSPLANGPELIYQTSSGSPIETILFLEGNFLRLGPWLPDEMMFSAFRFFPWLLFLLALPPLLRRLGATRSLSWLAVALCFFAPASAWWSFMPIRIMGFAVAGSFLLVLARDRWVDGRRFTGALQAALAGLLLARLVTYYVPWGLTTGFPLVLAVGVWLVWQKETRRAGLLVVGIGALVGGALLAGTMIENIEALRSELNTAYPGLRRSSGEAVPFYMLFAAPALFELNDDPTLTFSNQSELSQAFLICGLWAALLWSRMGPARDRASRAALWVLAGMLVLWASWIMVAWGPFGLKIPVLNLLPPWRIAQTIGFTAQILVCLVLARTRPGGGWRGAVAIGAGCALVTGYATSALMPIVTTLGAGEVWAASLVTGVLVALVTRFPRHWAPAVAVSVVTGFFALTVNPLVFGLGDLRGTDAADKVYGVGKSAEREGTYVVADNWGVDALMVANGVPVLTGYQVTGPVAEEWAKIDPTGKYEFEWNRGASYLKMNFTGERGSEPVITNPSPDVIMITLHPCWLADSDLDVGYVISSTPDLTPRCLERQGKLTWNNEPQYIYKVR